MAVSKVAYDGHTLIDLTQDTAVESDVASGKWFHKADGTRVQGTATGGITPTGTINITTNGTHNVTTYASASVNVPTWTLPLGTFVLGNNGYPIDPITAGGTPMINNGTLLLISDDNGNYLKNDLGGYGLFNVITNNHVNPAFIWVWIGNSYVYPTAANGRLVSLQSYQVLCLGSGIKMGPMDDGYAPSIIESYDYGMGSIEFAITGIDPDSYLAYNPDTGEFEAEPTPTLTRLWLVEPST